ncbi:hypothetical protein LSTR_LSTR003460 [Laodelphax striatellus]|uniref:VM domain-containing protein n=1 Tax=Laodelphax striatellus TaxID=195883 RepID=A0A482WYQ2_LAOST|nr:hypothetical protein LSTR_LSTR003460 [Laodelphax striatellus]
MYVFTLLVTVALAAVMNASAADSKQSYGSYGDGSKRRDSDYYHDSHYHDHDHYHEHDHDHSSHGADFEPPKTLVTRSLLPEVDAQLPGVAEPGVPTALNPMKPEVPTALNPMKSDVPTALSEGAATLAQEVSEDLASPLVDDPVAEVAALAGITENSSPINPQPYIYPNQGYPTQPPPQYMTSQPHYRPPPQYMNSQHHCPPPPKYMTSQPHYRPPPQYMNSQHHCPPPPKYMTSQPPYPPPPPPPQNPYGPPPPNPYGPPPPHYISA